MIRQAPLLDHGPVALQNTAFTQLETTSVPHRATCSTAFPNWAARDRWGHRGVPLWFNPSIFAQSCFLSTSRRIYAARMENGPA
ncbi:hypothetical protein MicloDRAFT_00051980 [Microvirga lotononidis]|uniref:Uncharacterized protein n=1 Tax=Microvirga lotononidis TaxID=864069 RepID=I4YKJ4_9HYPH|nr:hypothetical protein MicloDRAFT_00051980 [Microvirga lotononidis]